jgi:histidine phosphotransfer protein HptB
MKRDQYLEQIRQHLRTSYLLSDEKTAEVLPGFLSTLAEHLQRLEQIVQEGDLPAVGRVGHTVKGAFLNLGLVELAEIALIIEQGGKAENSTIDYAFLASQLKDEVNGLLP